MLCPFHSREGGARAGGVGFRLGITFPRAVSVNTITPELVCISCADTQEEAAQENSRGYFHNLPAVKLESTEKADSSARGSVR